MTCVYLDPFIYQNMNVFFEDEKLIHREHFENKKKLEIKFMSHIMGIRRLIVLKWLTS